MPARTRLPAAIALTFAAGAAVAAPVTFFGTGTATTAAEAAFAQWQAAVTGVSVDQLGGLAGTAGANALLTSSAGNVFATIDDLASVRNVASGVVQGRHLQLDRRGADATFTWTLPSVVDAFGFFAHDLDGGTLTVTLANGKTFTTQSAAGNDNNSFFGVTNLGSAVSLVTVSTSDPGGLAYFDRFAVATSRPVPLPATLVLVGLGVAGLGWIRRRQLAA
jgi:hypothetical protein